jgi:hypothetical protein
MNATAGDRSTRVSPVHTIVPVGMPGNSRPITSLTKPPMAGSRTIAAPVCGAICILDRALSSG